MDNVLKPFILAHGLSTPIPVIFIGVIGGVLAHGVAGLFVGPVVLAVVWELGRAWIAEEVAAAAPKEATPEPLAGPAQKELDASDAVSLSAQAASAGGGKRDGT